MTTTHFLGAEGIVPVRAGPDPQSERLTDLLFGEDFLVASEHEGLAFGTTDGIEGYVPVESLTPATGPATHRVRRIFIHVYHAPDLQAASGKILPMNARVALTGRSAAVRYPGGGPGSTAMELQTGGWITAQGVAPVDVFEPRLKPVVSSFLGAAYLHGGRTWLGCDGPGFVQTALAACGHHLPRQLAQQVSFFQRTHPALDALSPSSPARAAAIYAGDSCGLVLGEEVWTASTETMQVRVMPIGEFMDGIAATTTRPRIFALPSDLCA